MTTAPTPRRTQAQRREGTIGALLEATVTCLTERGYAATSTAAVCAEAGVSQGALFRHFPTRQALLVATAEHVAHRNVAAFRATTAGAAVDRVDDVADVLAHLRAAVLSPHARVGGVAPDSWEDPALVQLWGPRFSV